jgi:hypothetical protein
VFPQFPAAEPAELPSLDFPMKNHHHSHHHTDSGAGSASSFSLSHDEIASCARELWEQQGRPDDRDEAIWLEAEGRLRAARQGVSGVLPVAGSVL